MRQLIICSIFLFLLSTQTTPFPYRAFCHVPVADLFTAIPTNTHMGQPWDVKNLPSPYPRASQLLHNEHVAVTEKRNNYAHVHVLHWFYIPAEKTSKITDYWVQSQALTPVNNLDKKSQSYLPEPISFKNPQLYYKNVVTLTYPYTYKGTTYSAGTRFVIDSDQKEKDTISVKIYDPSTQKFTTVAIPSFYLHNKKLTTHESKRTLFLSLLESWIESGTDCFPYVLGGASITARHVHDEKIATRIVNTKETDKLFYYRPLYTQNLPMGIDCSHLITRAAHIAQIPLFAQNTSTFVKICVPIARDYTLKNGDLIVWKGHCCIIADIKNNMAIEARGYASGYGKIQKIPLKSLFKNVQTYKELLKKYFMHQPLLRIDKDGKVIQKIDNFLISPLIT